MKRIMIVLATLILILGVCALPVAAAGNGTLSATGAEGKQGDTVTVTVDLSSNPGLITMKFAVSYPSDLELTKVENSGLLSGWTTPAPTISSPYTIRWADSLAAANNTATGKLVTLTFKIKDSAAPGDKTVTVTFNESRDADGGKNTFSNASATVKVTCKTHSYGSYTSTGDAQHTRTCATCKYVETANHSWNSGTVTNEATCKEAGEKIVTCTVCNANQTVILDKLTVHTYDHSCDTDCNVCGMTRNITHNYGKWQKDISNHWKECSGCGEVKDYAAHTPGAPATEYKAQTCTVCGYVIKAALGHKHQYAQAWSSDEEFHWHICDCGDEGSKGRHNWVDGACSVCMQIQVVLPTTNPSEVPTTQPNTQPDNTPTTLPVSQPGEDSTTPPVSQDQASNNSDSDPMMTAALIAIPVIFILMAVVIIVAVKNKRRMDAQS